MKVTNPIEFVGCLSWTELRAFIIAKMEACRTEHEFQQFLSMLWVSIGTEQEIKKRRNKLGIPVGENLFGRKT